MADFTVINNLKLGYCGLLRLNILLLLRLNLFILLKVCFVICMCREDKDTVFFFFVFFSTIHNTGNSVKKKKISECAMDSVFWPFAIMSVYFEGGSVKTGRACLHLVTLCALLDRKSIWFVTFGHIRNGYKSDLELGLYRSIMSKKSTVRCILFIISQLKDRRSQQERAASALER